MTIPPFAPGCFGSALAFDEHHPFCAGCTFRAECQPMHVENLASLRRTLGVTIREPKAKPVVADQPTVERPGDLSLPRKVRELIARLDASNLNIVAKLQQGLNPFLGDKPYLAIFCHLLLKVDAVERSLLETACQRKLNWAEGTSRAHARMAFQALEHIGAIQVIDGRARLRRD